MVVSKNYASGWSDIVYDVSGRAIAANLDLTDDSTVRIVPTYGVTGSNSANFTSLYAKKIAEGLLIDCLTEKSLMCDNKGWHMIVAGDINSYQQPLLITMVALLWSGQNAFHHIFSRLGSTTPSVRDSLLHPHLLISPYLEVVGWIRFVLDQP